VLRGYLPPDRIAAIGGEPNEDDGDARATILHDADKLDKIGATACAPRLDRHSPIWISSALWRVGDDQARCPPRHFDLSRDLAASKRAVLRWFLPLAEDALDP